ncbi:hypothetical protein K438DRAFT_491311 [Mycena galopus ATCC 62051]|nr:hypothetical protein K438DRAFT_491311 [Mycena galopus ATCC 62051]
MEGMLACQFESQIGNFKPPIPPSERTSSVFNGRKSFRNASVAVMSCGTGKMLCSVNETRSGGGRAASTANNPNCRKSKSGGLSSKVRIEGGATEAAESQGCRILPGQRMRQKGCLFGRRQERRNLNLLCSDCHLPPLLGPARF